MPSQPSPLLRLELQTKGENLNAWGDKLNDLFRQVEQGIASVYTLTIADSRTLTADNYLPNEYRRGTHVLQAGSGLNAAFTLTLPDVEFVYRVVNLTAYPATYKTASGAGAVVRPGQTTFVICDGALCRAVDPSLDQIRAATAPVDLNGQRLTNVGPTTSAGDVPSRAEVLGLTGDSVQRAADWAQKTSGSVDGANGFSARAWATSTTALTGGFKGAYSYAVDAAGSATSAGTSATNAGTAATQATTARDDFLNRYRVGAGYPTTGNFDGRLAWNTTSARLGVYNSAVGAYDIITVPQQATTTAPGIIEIATQAEASAGTDNTRAITPLTLVTELVARIRQKRYDNVVFLTSSQTFTAPANIRGRVSVIGGFGSGSVARQEGGSAAAATGGAAPGLGIKLFTASAGAQATATIGAGGASSQANAGISQAVQGKSGGQSRFLGFGCDVTASGGGGGNATIAANSSSSATAASALGGTAAGGDLNYTGGASGAATAAAGSTAAATGGGALAWLGQAFASGAVNAGAGAGTASGGAGLGGKSADVAVTGAFVASAGASARGPSTGPTVDNGLGRLTFSGSLYTSSLATILVDVRLFNFFGQGGNAVGTNAQPGDPGCGGGGAANGGGTLAQGGAAGVFGGSGAAAAVNGPAQAGAGTPFSGGSLGATGGVAVSNGSGGSATAQAGADGLIILEYDVVT